MVASSGLGNQAAIVQVSTGSTRGPRNDVRSKSDHEDLRCIYAIYHVLYILIKSGEVIHQIRFSDTASPVSPLHIQ